MVEPARPAAIRRLSKVTSLRFAAQDCHDLEKSKELLADLSRPVKIFGTLSKLGRGSEAATVEDLACCFLLQLSLTRAAKRRGCITKET